MPLEDRSSTPFERRVGFTGRILEGGASLVGLVLPTWALIRLQNLPEDVARIAYVILPTVSLAVVVAILIRGADIGRLSKRDAASLTLGLAVAGAIFTASYSVISDKLVYSLVDATEAGEVVSEVHVSPIVPRQEIRDILEECERDYEFALSDECPGAAALKSHMYRGRTWSVAVLLTMVLLAQLFFVAALVGGAWWLAEHHLASPPEDRRSRQGEADQG